MAGYRNGGGQVDKWTSGQVTYKRRRVASGLASELCNPYSEGAVPYVGWSGIGADAVTVKAIAYSGESATEDGLEVRADREIGGYGVYANVVPKDGATVQKLRNRIASLTGDALQAAIDELYLRKSHPDKVAYGGKRGALGRTTPDTYRLLTPTGKHWDALYVRGKGAMLQHVGSSVCYDTPSHSLTCDGETPSATQNPYPYVNALDAEDQALNELFRADKNRALPFAINGSRMLVSYGSQYNGPDPFRESTFVATAGVCGGGDAESNELLATEDIKRQISRHALQKQALEFDDPPRPVDKLAAWVAAHPDLGPKAIVCTGSKHISDLRFTIVYIRDPILPTADCNVAVLGPTVHKDTKQVWTNLILGLAPPSPQRSEQSTIEPVCACGSVSYKEHPRGLTSITQSKGSTVMWESAATFAAQQGSRVVAIDQTTGEQLRQICNSHLSVIGRWDIQMEGQKTPAYTLGHFVRLPYVNNRQLNLGVRYEDYFRCTVFVWLDASVAINARDGVLLNVRTAWTEKLALLSKQARVDTEHLNITDAFEPNMPIETFVRHVTTNGLSGLFLEAEVARCIERLAVNRVPKVDPNDLTKKADFELSEVEKLTEHGASSLWMAIGLTCHVCGEAGADNNPNVFICTECTRVMCKTCKSSVARQMHSFTGSGLTVLRNAYTKPRCVTAMAERLNIRKDLMANCNALHALTLVRPVHIFDGRDQLRGDRIQMELGRVSGPDGGNLDYSEMAGRARSVFAKGVSEEFQRVLNATGLDRSCNQASVLMTGKSATAQDVHSDYANLILLKDHETGATYPHKFMRWFGRFKLFRDQFWQEQTHKDKLPVLAMTAFEHPQTVDFTAATQPGQPWRRFSVKLNPGDVAVWGPDVAHGASAGQSQFGNLSASKAYPFRAHVYCDSRTVYRSTHPDGETFHEGINTEIVVSDADEGGAAGESWDQETEDTWALTMFQQMADDMPDSPPRQATKLTVSSNVKKVGNFAFSKSEHEDRLIVPGSQPHVLEQRKIGAYFPFVLSVSQFENDGSDVQTDVHTIAAWCMPSGTAAAGGLVTCHVCAFPPNVEFEAPATMADVTDGAQVIGRTRDVNNPKRIYWRHGVASTASTVDLALGHVEVLVPTGNVVPVKEEDDGTITLTHTSGKRANQVKQVELTTLFASAVGMVHPQQKGFVLAVGNDDLPVSGFRATFMLRAANVPRFGIIANDNVVVRFGNSSEHADVLPVRRYFKPPDNYSEPAHQRGKLITDWF